MTRAKNQIWIPFYMEFADKLRPYASDRTSLLKEIEEVYAALGMRVPTLERGAPVDIDPFTVFGLFNKGITNTNRIAIARELARRLSVQAPVPENFDGVPVVMNQSATFYYFLDDREDGDIDRLWRMFEVALECAEADTMENRNAFIQCFDAVVRQKGVKWNLTMGLYWIRPYAFINLDSRNRWFLCQPGNMPESFIERVNGFRGMPSGKDYLNIVHTCRQELETGAHPYTDFPGLSDAAWRLSEEINAQNRAQRASGAAEEESTVDPTSEADAGAEREAQAVAPIGPVRYWLYSPGEGARMWDTFRREGIMGIGWEEIGDLRVFASKNEMKRKMKECYGAEHSYLHDAHATWQFANEMKPGDVVFAKKGMRTLVGRGVVTSDYYFDDQRAEYNNVRRVNWTDAGEWPHPGQAATKTLTDITDYTDYVKELNRLFEKEQPEEAQEREVDYPDYTSADFLREVYMEPERYERLARQLRRKKNVILQGAPGVGKTFAATRLADAMMGKRDTGRVMTVQFHQSYSYEDFVMGYRPAGAGFELKEGPFYEFCKRAEIDSERPYFLIIDEINRGNMSKIFGELFMLIEADKRGKKVKLMYRDEQFSVPENLYIIGTMNTADRSLAILDFALRRRFAFFEFPPAFGTEGFRSYQVGKHNTKFDNLIAAVERLNAEIESDGSLGRGFCIGHSYFCTREAIDDDWLNSVISFELVPLLEEYWFDAPDNVRRWEKDLREAVQ